MGWSGNLRTLTTNRGRPDGQTDRLLLGEAVQDKLRDRLRLLALQEVTAVRHELEPVRAGKMPGLALHHLG